MQASACREEVHATVVDWLGRGILLRGAPGAGKSALALRLIGAGAYLVADDLVRLTRRRDAVYASAVAGHGLIELRAGGIFQVATAREARVGLCVELDRQGDGERLPTPTSATILGIELPVVRAAAADAASVARVQVALLARRVV